MSPAEILILVAVTALIALALRGLKLSWGLSAGLPAGVAVLYVVFRLAIMNVEQALTLCIFLLVYGLIASDKLYKAKVALAGATAMIIVGLIHQHDAFHGSERAEGIDWNTIMLLIGMMIIVNITRQTGVFEWLAIKAAKLAKGHPIRIMILLAAITAVVSALLDNVTTVLLIAPVTILICQSLRTDPVPFLICVVLSSNIGGAATLIGHPPNIIIGSTARLSFVDFLRVDAPPALLALGALFVGIWLVLGKRIKVSDQQRAEIMQFDEKRAITDHPLLKRCLVVIGLVLFGFVIHGYLHLEPATVALAGAALLFLLYDHGPEAALREVEWPTIFFFMGLFIMVSAMVQVGLVELLGQGLLNYTKGNTFAMTMLILWFSAIAAGIMDNIPFVATMVALVHSVAATLHPEAANYIEAAHAPDVIPLWWALSLGACLGANFSPIGAATNVVVVGVAARAGHPISFLRFIKYGVPAVLMSLIISSFWLWLMFLR